MARAFIILLDSFGIGASADAKRYGDEGADTLRHIAEYCSAGKADIAGVRKGALHLPNLSRLGLNEAAKVSQGSYIPGWTTPVGQHALFGCAKELSLGKDTPSGHWEIAGLPVLFDWGYFPPDYPSFPDDLVNEFIQAANVPGILGNKHASGTEIIKEFGLAHQQSGMPICYTSGDSVFQIAAHEETFGLQRLYDICCIARKLVDPLGVGRVIARPFKGVPGQYVRTGNRRDYSIPPPGPTLLDAILAAGGEVVSVGKVADIYAHQGISKKIKADGNDALFEGFLAETAIAQPNTLVFVNLVDFDMLYGHRRDVAGYAHALEKFDASLPRFEALMQPGDIAVITADHGCDPTRAGSDHTREHIPVLAFGPDVVGANIGLRSSFADIGQSLAQHLNLAPLQNGQSFL